MYNFSELATGADLSDRSNTPKSLFKKFKATSPVKSALQVTMDKNSFLNS